MRPIDADELLDVICRDQCERKYKDCDYTCSEVAYVVNAPTLAKDIHVPNNGWISVKDGLPKEHPSIFAEMYGTEKWRSGMWRTESDRVLVTIKFPDNTRTVDKGRLQDGAWRTGVSPVLPQEVTHWAVWPEPAEEEEAP